jgi:hypothetical protein
VSNRCSYKFGLVLLAAYVSTADRVTLKFQANERPPLASSPHPVGPYASSANSPTGQKPCTVVYMDKSSLYPLIRRLCGPLTRSGLRKNRKISFLCRKSVQPLRLQEIWRLLGRMYKPAGRGFDSRWCHWNFSVTSFRSHYGPGVDSASNRNEYQVYFLGVKAAGV